MFVAKDNFICSRGFASVGSFDLLICSRILSD